MKVGRILLMVENILALTELSIPVVLQIEGCNQTVELLTLYFCMKVVKVNKVLLSLSKRQESFSMPTLFQPGKKTDDLFTRINRLFHII